MDYFIRTQDDFDRCKQMEFAPGDRILFAAGHEFYGQFAPRCQGTPERPILIGAFSPATGHVLSGPAPEKPVIHGMGQVDAVVKLWNPSFCTIENLAVTNTDGSAGDQGKLYGIRVIGEDAGKLENVCIRWCRVADVNGMVAGKERGGIHVDVVGTGRKTWFDGLRIEENMVKNVGGVGISTSSTWNVIGSAEWTPWTNVLVCDNWVERTGRNGIIIRVSERPVIEYNTLAYSSRADTGHSVFTFDTRDAVIQHNEAYGNTGALDEADRGGFDADFKCEGTVIQYNYSHHNHWFCGIMRKYNKDVVIRYNVSINDLLGAYMYGFPDDDNLHGVHVHDNIHYFDKSTQANVFASPGRLRVPIKTRFTNNVFIFEKPAGWGVEPDQSCEFHGNQFYNFVPGGDVLEGTDPGSTSDTLDLLRQTAFIAKELLRAGVGRPELFK